MYRGLLSCLGGNVFQSIVPEASSARSQSKDAKPDTSDSGGSEGLPAQAYGWVVDQRSLAFRRRRYFSVLGRLDCTSMVSRRQSSGSQGVHERCLPLVAVLTVLPPSLLLLL